MLGQEVITRITAEAIGSKLDNFEFICGLIIEQKVLIEISFTSKLLQSQNMDVKSTTIALRKTIEFLVSHNCEDNCLRNTYFTTKSSCNRCGFKDDFSLKTENRIRKRDFLTKYHHILLSSFMQKLNLKQNFSLIFVSSNCFIEKVF